MFANILAHVKSTVNQKIQQHIVRLLKNVVVFAANKNVDRKHMAGIVKLRNVYILCIKNIITNNGMFLGQFYLQFLKTVSPLLVMPVHSHNSNTTPIQ